jgi:hypothetical protein
MTAPRGRMTSLRVDDEMTTPAVVMPRSGVIERSKVIPSLP